MALQKFPMDEQTCSLILKSFGYTNNSLQFHWDKYKPLTRHQTLQMSQFSLQALKHRNCDDSSEDNDTFTCLAVDLKLHRSVGFYMIQLYIPSGLIVVLSWVSFCLDVGAVPARISLGILTVLTMTNMKTIAVSSLPKVSYIKAIDIWMAMCLAFVFASLLEFAIVNAFARRTIPARRAWTVVVEAEPLKDSPRHCNSNGPGSPAVDTYVPDPDGANRANMIDKLSMILFPVAFMAFIAIYVLVYK